MWPLANYTMRSVQASAFLRVMITLKTLNRNRRVASLVGRGERIGDGRVARVAMASGHCKEPNNNQEVTEKHACHDHRKGPDNLVLVENHGYP